MHTIGISFFGVYIVLFYLNQGFMPIIILFDRMGTQEPLPLRGYVCLENYTDEVFIVLTTRVTVLVYIPIML